MMADLSATHNTVADCRYALTLLPDPVYVADRGNDELVAKISDDYYCFISPDDGRVPDWLMPAGDDWSGESETVGDALVVHFTRSA